MHRRFNIVLPLLFITLCLGQFSGMQDIEAKKLFDSYGFTFGDKTNSFSVVLPSNLIHDAGEYPVKIYWAVAIELSKSQGLDFSEFLGTEVRIEIYHLGVIVRKNGRIVGAYITFEKNRSIARSLEKRSLEDVTNKNWNEWIDAHINYDNPIEIMLSKMSPEEVVSTYYGALAKNDRKLAWACFTRKAIYDYLFSNNDNSCLYNENFPDWKHENLKNMKIVYLKELKHLEKFNQPGEVEFEVSIETRFEDNYGIQKIRMGGGYPILIKETLRGGWRIKEINTGR